MNCKIIVTCFCRCWVRIPKTWKHNVWPGQLQDLENENDIIRLMQDILKLEENEDPGVPMDTIIVNNDTGYKPGNEFLKKIDNQPTKRGKMRVLTRKNIGRAFGGYNYAFEQFRDQYKYWLFTEDDHLLFSPNYYKYCIDTFEQHKKCGFVSVLGTRRSRSRLGNLAKGGLGLTHVDVLNQVYEDIQFSRPNSLPYYNKQDVVSDAKKYSSRDYNEIQKNHAAQEWNFTLVIIKLGYKVVTLPQHIWLSYYHYKKGERNPSKARYSG